MQSFDTGSFMHEVIDKFFKRVKEQNLELGNLMAEEEIVVKFNIEIKFNTIINRGHSTTPK